MPEDPMPEAERRPQALGDTSFHARRARSGDESSRAWLVTHLTPLLEAQARYRLGPILRRHVDPMDLVDEVWMIALPRLGDLVDRDDRLAPVLLRFLASILLRRVNGLLRKYRPGEGSSEAVGDTGDDGATSVPERASRNEAADLIRQALGALDDKDRTVMVLRGIEQLPNEVAARLLGEVPNTVAVRYRRALERLRSLLPRSVFSELE